MLAGAPAVRLPEHVSGENGLLLIFVELGQKTGVWMLLMSQLNVHQAHPCQAPPDATDPWVGLDFRGALSFPANI